MKHTFLGRRRFNLSFDAWIILLSSHQISPVHNTLHKHPEDNSRVTTLRSDVVLTCHNIIPKDLNIYDRKLCHGIGIQEVVQNDVLRKLRNVTFLNLLTNIFHDHSFDIIKTLLRENLMIIQIMSYTKRQKI